MKKTAVLLLALVLALTASVPALAESTVFDLLAGLIPDGGVTLTVSAEAEGELAELIRTYGTVTCTLVREAGGVVLNASCEGKAYLTARATAEDVSFETNLIENGAFRSSWAALEPAVTAEAREISIRMTGPDHELITFSCKVTGTDPADCEVEIHIGFITGPGNVHSLWDGITSRDGEAGREFYFTFSEEEYALEGEGTSVTETDEGGALTVTRDEELTVLHNEEELGTILFRSVLTVR